MTSTETTSTDPRAAQGQRAVVAFALRAGLGVAFLALFLWLYGAKKIGTILAHERLDLFASAVALYVAGQVMSSYRWLLLARINQIGGPWREYLRYYFIGMATNLFVPGLIGGDAARAAYLGLRRRKMPQAIASVVADRGIGLVALFWMAAMATALVATVRLPRNLTSVTMLLGGALLVGFVAAPWLIAPARRLNGRLAKLIDPLLPYLERPLALTPAIVLSLLLQTSLAVCQYLLALGMGLNVPLSAVLLIVPMANVAASLPLTFNGLGLREGAYILLFGLAGLSHQDAVALGLLWFACTMVGGLTGLVPLIMTPVPQPDPILSELAAVS